MFVQDSVFKGSLIWPESFSPSSGSWKMPLSPLWAWESAGWFCTCFVASLCVPANGNIKSYQHCGEFQFDFCVLVWSPAVLGLLGFWGRGEFKEIQGQGRALLCGHLAVSSLLSEGSPVQGKVPEFPGMTSAVPKVLFFAHLILLTQWNSLWWCKSPSTEFMLDPGLIFGWAAEASVVLQCRRNWSFP